MAFSYKEYTTRSSGQREFAFAFDAVAKDTTNIKVTIGGVHLYDGVTEYNTTTRLPGTGSTPEAEYTVSSGSITIKTNANSAAVTFTVSGVTVTDGVPTLSSSVPLRIFRQTNRDTAEVTFSSGSILADSDLNKANNQARFLSLEAVDRADESISIDGNDSTQYNIQIEGADKRIFGVAAPSNANDAVPKSYADTTVTSAETYRNKAQDYRDTAESYATRIDGPAQTFSGAANNSSGTGSNTSDYSAKNWAVGVHASNTPSDGSAKEWAIGGEGTVGNAVSGGEYSAKKHAQDASDSATAAAASETAAAASAAATAQIFDKFDDKYLGQMADNATATDADTTGTWAKNSSVITVASKSNIIVGQEVTGSGIPTDANVISISSSSNEVTISENMAAAGSNVDLDFRGQGVYGAYNGTKDGPALNNDGDALVSGNLYFNTTDGEMRVYDGSSWIAASAAQNATMLEYVYDITGTVTAIVGASGTGFAENNNASVSFGSNESVHVYLNGVQLIEGASDDYQLNASSNTVTFNSAVVSGDIVKIVVYKTFTVGDAVPASTGGTFSGNVAVTGDLTVDTDTLKVDSAGNKVGIGTASPNGTLTCRNDSSNTSQLILGNTLNTGGRDWRLGRDNAATGDFIVYSSDNTDSNNTTERMRINSSGNVGINESPNRHSFQSGCRVLTVKGNGTDDFGVLELLSPNTTSSNRLGEVRFGNMDGHATAVIATAGIRATRDGADDATALSLWAGGSGGMSQRMGIASSGDVTVNTGNLVIGTAGKGIDFSNASGSASGSSSALLDDYEEGTWSPQFTDGTTTKTLSSGLLASNGSYTKIGRMVFCLFYINLSNTTSLSGPLLVSNLPFTVANVLPDTGVDGAGYLTYFGNLSNPTGCMTLTLNGGQTTGYLYRTAGSGSTSMPALNNSDITSSFNMRGYLSYFTT